MYRQWNRQAGKINTCMREDTHTERRATTPTPNSPAKFSFQLNMAAVCAIVGNKRFFLLVKHACSRCGLCFIPERTPGSHRKQWLLTPADIVRAFCIPSLCAIVPNTNAAIFNWTSSLHRHQHQKLIPVFGILNFKESMTFNERKLPTAYRDLLFFSAEVGWTRTIKFHPQNLEQKKKRKFCVKAGTNCHWPRETDTNTIPVCLRH